LSLKSKPDIYSYLNIILHKPNLYLEGDNIIKSHNRQSWFHYDNSHYSAHFHTFLMNVRAGMNNNIIDSAFGILRLLFYSPTN